MKIVPVTQVTLLLPLLRAPDSEQVTSTTVPGTTGNCVVDLIVLFHSALSLVQFTVKVLDLEKVQSVNYAQ